MNGFQLALLKRSANWMISGIRTFFSSICKCFFIDIEYFSRNGRMLFQLILLNCLNNSITSSVDISLPYMVTFLPSGNIFFPSTDSITSWSISLTLPSRLTMHVKSISSPFNGFPAEQQGRNIAKATEAESTNYLDK